MFQDWFISWIWRRIWNANISYEKAAVFLLNFFVSIFVWSYSAGQLRWDTYWRGKSFPLFSPPFQKIFGTNDTSFESPNIGHLESAQKLGVASSWGWPCPLNWKSTSFTRARLEPFMTEILPVSVLLSNGTL